MSSGDSGDCAAGDCCGDVDRRAFLKAAGMGVVSLSSVGGGLPVMAGQAQEAQPQIEHYVPADKKLAREWIRGLYERGKPSVYRGKELDTIGMPVGGIAAGQLYLRGDGTLAEWKIFNARNFSGYGRTNYQYRTPTSPVEQGFAVVVNQRGKTSLRRLSRVNFSDVEFTGQYPIGRVSYRHSGFPVAVTMEAFSPFIPLNARESALPATIFHIQIKNTSTESLDVGLLAWLENAVCFHNAPELRALRRSRIVQQKSRTLIVHSAEPPREEPPPPREPILLADFEGEDYGDWAITGEAFGEKPAGGTLPRQNPVSGFVGEGMVNTFRNGDAAQGTLVSPPFTISRKYINFLLGGGNHPEQTCINLLIDGKVVRTATGENTEKLKWRSWRVEDLEGKEALIQIVDHHTGGWGHVNVDQIELSDEGRGGPSGPIEKLSDFGTLVLALNEKGAPAPQADKVGIGLHSERDIVYRASEKRAATIASESGELKPGESRTFTLALTWCFPNRDNGHAYCNDFADASEVARHVLDNHERLAGQTHRWRETIYDSTLPNWLLERIGSTVCNLATGTCQWWKNGRFWAWEGVGCCSGTCTHVWNYAHAAARLFPELERSAREMQDLGEALHDDGLVGFRGQQNKAYAADGQAGTVLKCYREHQMSPDGDFLKRNWPNIKKVLGYSIRQDADDDGLIENSQHNTYDINFHGPNTFVGSLYLAALRAGEEMARDAGDSEFAERLRAIFESGSRLSTERLWSGEYFIQRVDLEKHPKYQYGDGCLSDQLFGQGWAHQLGLGYIYPVENVRQALRSVWKYNWTPDISPQSAKHKPERWFAGPGEAGLFTCTWPRSEYLKAGVRYKNEVWTGIEYQVAGHMIWEGMVDEALAIIRAIHDRYHPLKHNPYNEIECGDHYARALASWGAYTALCGYEYHGPKRHIGFSPRMTPEDFRAAFTAAEGWGAFSQTRKASRQTERIEVRWGKLRVQTLAFTVGDRINTGKVSVKVDGRELAATQTLDGNRLTIQLSTELTISERGAIDVTIG